jgi:response regulator of citrate/malate metabolism
VIRALCVDDDWRVADLHCDYVRRVPGFAVVGTAHGGIEAIEKIDALRPDLVLLDLYLPDLPGLEVLRRLREEEHAPVDVIAITAARDVQSLQSAIRGGVVHYLVKPFLFSAFEQKLTSYAAARARLATLLEADQGEVDRIFGAMRPAAREQPPKGLSELTLDLVVDTLRRADAGLPALAIAEATGLSRVTARRYLDHLCQIGAVELVLRYGAPGRPEHRYRLVRGAPGER